MGRVHDRTGRSWCSGSGTQETTQAGARGADDARRRGRAGRRGTRAGRGRWATSGQERRLCDDVRGEDAANENGTEHMKRCLRRILMTQRMLTREWAFTRHFMVYLLGRFGLGMHRLDWRLGLLATGIGIHIGLLHGPRESSGVPLLLATMACVHYASF